MLNRRLLAALLSGALVIILVLIVLFNNISTVPVVLETTEGEATIFFSADRDTVANPGDCVTVQWQVEEIRAVYLNGEAMIGSGERSICVSPHTMPTLTVIFQDSSTHDYVLEIDIVADRPFIWPLIIAAMVLVISSIYLLLAAVFGPSRSWVQRLTQSPLARKSARILVIFIFSLLVTSLLLEIGLRIYFTNFGTRGEKIMYILSVEEIRELEAAVLPMPYVNFIPSPYHEDHNDLGYRGPEIELPKPEGTYRIVALGGSTTYSTGTTAEDSYSAQLQRILREDYGYPRVEVVNAGVSGYTSWETLVNFAFRVLELEPDMIVLYGAVNDLVARENMFTDCYRGNNALRGINGARGIWVDRDQPLSPSVLYRFVAINLGVMDNPLALESAFTPAPIRCGQSEPTMTLEERLAANIPIYFERNIRNIVALAEVNGVQPVLSTWVYNVDAERPELWRQEIDAHNQIIRQLAEEMDVPLYDLEANFPVNSALWEQDGIHMVASGAQEQASQYATFLVEQGLIP